MKKIRGKRSLHVDVDLVLVDVTVTDRHDHLVTGRASDNFRIFENNVEQKIQYSSSVDVPISVGFIFDLSGSMANKIAKSKEAALQFLRSANPQDEFFLVTFSDCAKLISAFTNSVEDLQEPPALGICEGQHGPPRCHLSGSLRDEDRPKRQTRFAYHFRRKR